MIRVGALLLASALLACVPARNPYRDDLYRTVYAQNDTQRAILAFSEQLRLAMGLTPADVREALRSGHEWPVGFHTVYAAARPWNEWQPHLEVQYGRVMFHPMDREGWLIRRAGISTEVLPLEDERERILEQVRFLRNGPE